MRIGTALACVLFVVGLAVAVASPSLVDRRSPTFAELFERFRSSDVTVTYRRNFGASTVRLAKSGDNYLLRIDGGPPFGDSEEYRTLITPRSATYCLPLVFARAAGAPECSSRPPLEGNFLRELSRIPGLPLRWRYGPYGGGEQRLLWSRQLDRVVLGARSWCFRATPEPDEGMFELCFDSRGDLLYAGADYGHGEITLEATSVDHSVDMSVFDTKKFLNEN